MAQDERANGLDALRLQSLSEQREYLEYARWEKGLVKVAHGVNLEPAGLLHTQVEVSDLLSLYPLNDTTSFDFVIPQRAKRP
jgi:hypothetical protein